MRLYLSANSKKKVGYVPDWIKFNYKENDQSYELTLDIQGWIDYDGETLNCRCKADLVPWTLYNQTDGSELDLYDMDEEEVDAMFPYNKIVNIFREGTDFVVGIYPDNDERLDDAEEDVLSDCKGSYDTFIEDTDMCTSIHISGNFAFETEFSKA